MAYVSNVPQAGQTLAASQPIMNANFTGLKTYLDVNHEAIDSTYSGMHTKVEMPALGSDPDTVAGVAAVYSNINSSTVDCFYRAPSSGLITNLSAVKAFGNFAGASGTVANGRNVTSVTRNSTGNYTVTMTTAMQDANYTVTLACDSAAAGTFGQLLYTTRTTTTFVIQAATLGGAAMDPTSISFSVIR